MPDTGVVDTTRARPSKADSVRFSIASNAMEGVFTDKETEAVLMAWAEGKLSDDELLAVAVSGELPVSAAYALSGD